MQAKLEITGEERGTEGHATLIMKNFVHTQNLTAAKIFLQDKLLGMLMFKVTFSLFFNTNQSACSTIDGALSSQSELTE